jgi:hypothetical protein
MPSASLWRPYARSGLRHGRLTVRGAELRGWNSERILPVLDVIYLGVGVGVLALMALYAYACDRL